MLLVGTTADVAFEPGAFFIAARNARKSKKARENNTCSGSLPLVFRVFTLRGTLSLGRERWAAKDTDGSK
jgi:hypothetical protein